MSNYHTVFGSMDRYEKGSIEIINDNPKYYVFSNIFEVANKSKPYEKVAVAKNLEYVIEAIRAEGTSSWQTCAHDEFCVVMDGEVTVEYVKLDNAEAIVPAGKEGSVQVKGEPKGKRMGTIKLKRGHQAMLPKGAAYRFKASRPSVMIQQTLKGDLTQERWGQICQQ
jgi:hypothetical protein